MENLTNYISHHPWILTAMFIIVILAFIFMIIYTIVTISKNTKKRKEFISEMKVGDDARLYASEIKSYSGTIIKIDNDNVQMLINVNISDIAGKKE